MLVFARLLIVKGIEMVVYSTIPRVVRFFSWGLEAKGMLDTVNAPEIAQTTSAYSYYCIANFTAGVSQRTRGLVFTASFVFGSFLRLGMTVEMVMVAVGLNIGHPPAVMMHAVGRAPWKSLQLLHSIQHPTSQHRDRLSVQGRCEERDLGQDHLVG